MSAKKIDERVQTALSYCRARVKSDRRSARSQFQFERRSKYLELIRAPLKTFMLKRQVSAHAHLGLVNALHTREFLA